MIHRLQRTNANNTDIFYNPVLNEHIYNLFITVL